MFGPSLTAAAVVTTALGLAATADTAAPNEERLGGYIGIYDDIGPGYCTKTGGPRVQTVLCDSSSAAGKGKCAYTQESCAALCTADSHCTGYMTQDMSQYQEPPTCVLVTPNAPSGPQWVVQNSGGGFSIGEHDGETRDHCYRKSSAPAPPSPTPGPPAPGGGCFQEVGNGYCVKTSGGSNRCQNYFCDDSSLHPDTCPKTQAACAALCAADSKCSGYVLQDMSMYNVPNTCALVTSTKPAAVPGNWVLANSGGGFEIGGHDSQQRDTCYKKAPSGPPCPPGPSPSPPPPPPPPPPPGPPPPPPGPPAGFHPRLAASLLPRPKGGYHNFSLLLYGGPFLAQGDAFANLTAAMRRFGVGGGFDPLVVGMAAAAAAGWPVSMNPPQGGNRCFQVPECPNNMSQSQVQDLALFKQANVYSQIQFGEWGYYFANLQPGKNGGNEQWWHAVFPDDADFQRYFSSDATPFKDSAGKRLYGFTTMPGSRVEAYEAYRSYYNGRIAWLSSVGAVPYNPAARIYSMNQVPGGGPLVIYAALWNSQGPNFNATVNTAIELQTGDEANLAFAMARGSARRFGKPWSVQTSGWGFGPKNGVCGPLMCTPKGKQQRAGACTAEEVSSGAACRGAEASHSYSWYWRVWHHVWFAGAAAVTEEGPAMGLFGCDDDGTILTDFATLTRHGRQAQSLQRTVSQHDRGAAITPLGIVIDLHLGYGTGGVGKASWSVIPLSDNDLMFDDLVHQQLYVSSGRADDVLQTTPHGELADVMLSDAASDYLALYPVLLLVGDQSFGDAGGLGARLLAAMQANTTRELVVQPFHMASMSKDMAAKLQSTGKLTVIDPPPLSSTGRKPAIAPAQLDAIAHAHLPAVVTNATLASGDSVHILWQVNRQQTGGGFVIELSNNHGVEKAPCSPMVLDPQGAVSVTIVLGEDARTATDWTTGQVLAAGPLRAGDALTVVVAPGNTSFVEFAEGV